MMIKAAIIQVVRIEFEIGIPPMLKRSVADVFTPSEAAKTKAGDRRPMRERGRI
jgi:hypothetical protein